MNSSTCKGNDQILDWTGRISAVRRDSHELQKQVRLITDDVHSNTTSYWRIKLKPTSIKEAHDQISNNFIDFFQERGYHQLRAVDINSWIDDSVYFIGAPISVMKPYLVSKNIPVSGLTMAQPSIRTRNSKTISDLHTNHNWWSFFTWVATLVNYSDKERLLIEAIEFLIQRLHIPLEKIRINISSKDHDLIHLLNKVKCPIELVFDSKIPVYYTHKYWLWPIVWRNFNFTLQEVSSWEFRDIWNFIIIENGEEKYGVELAMGVSVIMKELYELWHTLETSNIDAVFPGCWDPIRQKFQDAVITSIVILRSWVRPNSSNTKGRVLKNYLLWIRTLASSLLLQKDDIAKLIKKYEVMEFWEDSGITDILLGYI